MLPMALIPITATPRDTKATLARLSSAVQASGQKYSQFEAKDQVSLSGAQREQLTGALTEMSKARNAASALRDKDNVFSESSHKDLDPAFDRYYSAEPDGSSTTVTWDSKGQPTSYSHQSATSKTSALFQEDEASAFFALLGPESSSGLVFDKAAQTATVFHGWTSYAVF